MNGPTPADFDLWNERKKDIHAHGVAPLFREREVWWCNLGVNIQHEQNGDTVPRGGQPATYRRPVLILRKFGADSCAVLPLTTQPHNGSYYAPLGMVKGRENWVLLAHIRTISAARLTARIATIPHGDFEAVLSAYAALMGLKK